jgi:hypothetical protein
VRTRNLIYAVLICWWLRLSARMAQLGYANLSGCKIHHRQIQHSRFSTSGSKGRSTLLVTTLLVSVDIDDYTISRQASPHRGSHRLLRSSVPGHRPVCYNSQRCQRFFSHFFQVGINCGGGHATPKPERPLRAGFIIPPGGHGYHNQILATISCVSIKGVTILIIPIRADGSVVLAAHLP